MVIIIDFGSSKVPAIHGIVSELGYACKIINWKEAEATSVENATYVILSGAPILLTSIDYNGYLHQFQFLNNLTIPVLGICFGHQLLGLLNGATVYKGEEVRTPIPIKMLQQHFLFQNIANHSLFAQDHTEGISLPNHFTLLANSTNYAVEVMHHQTKKIMGVQFHPETSGEVGKKLLLNFLTQK